MKIPNTLASLVFAGTAAMANGQNLIDSATFFNPDFKVNHANSAGLFTTTADAVEDTQAASGVSWTLSAGGYTGLSIAGTGAHLAGFVQTTGDTLVFGRQLTTTGLAGALGPILEQVLGAAQQTTWGATATVSDLDIDAGKLYQVTFNVAGAAGLPLDLLSNFSFGITTDGVTGASNESATTLSILGIAPLGDEASTGDFTFVFQSDSDRSDLTFAFNADSIVGVGVLGGDAGNQKIMTLSGFHVDEVPEPSALMFSVVFAGAALLRRRRA